MMNLGTRLAPESVRLVLRACAFAALVAGVTTSMGCANGEFRLGDPFDRELSLEEAQHRYTVLVRWSDFQRAKVFVAKDERDAFLERMEALEEARFTDYESDSIELDEENLRAWQILYISLSKVDLTDEAVEARQRYLDLKDQEGK